MRKQKKSVMKQSELNQIRKAQQEQRKFKEKYKGKKGLSKKELQQLKSIKAQQEVSRRQTRKKSGTHIDYKNYKGGKFIVLSVDGRAKEKVKYSKGWNKQKAIDHYNKEGSINKDIKKFTWSNTGTVEQNYYGNKRSGFVRKNKYQFVIEADVLSHDKWKHIAARSDQHTSSEQSMKSARQQALERFYGLVTYSVFQESNGSRFDEIPEKNIRNYNEHVVTYRREKQQTLR